MTTSSSICALVLILCSSGIAVTGYEGTVISGTIENPETLVNYITTAVLPDGESETRMRFGDIIVREASITKTNQAGVR